MNVLIINAGSSSLKYQLMNPETGEVSAKGLCERIGIDGRLNHTAHGTNDGGILAKMLPNGAQLLPVALVQGIVFADDAYGPQKDRRLSQIFSKEGLRYC